jgi:proline iminopeptidase
MRSAALAAFTSPVLLLAGEVDLNIAPRLSAEFAGAVPRCQARHPAGRRDSPWLDDAGWFAAAVSAFLDEG